MPILEQWDEQVVIGAYSQETYEKLPPGYREEVDALTLHAQNRADRRDNGETIGKEEMDTFGLRENKLRLPPLVVQTIGVVTDSIVDRVRKALLLDHEALMPILEGHLQALDANDLLDSRILLEKIYSHLTLRARNTMRLGLEELIVNALKHGNTGDLRKRVTISNKFDLAQGVVRIEVRDEGHGFVPGELPDPYEMLMNEHGRGLLLTDEYCDRELREGGKVAFISYVVRDRFITMMTATKKPEILDIIAE